MMQAVLVTALFLFCVGRVLCGAAEQDLSAVFKRLDSLEQQLHEERQDKATLRAELGLLVGQVVGLQAMLHQFSIKTEARLEQCEADTHPFIKEMDTQVSSRNGCFCLIFLLKLGPGCSSV